MQNQNKMKQLIKLGVELIFYGRYISVSNKLLAKREFPQIINAIHV